MPRQVKRYGWIPDVPDVRDHLFSAPLPTLLTLPPKSDLRAKCPPVLDQGQLGSCTANAIANAHLFDQMKQKALDAFAPSRLFIYYNERVMEHTVSEDSGAMIRDGIKSISKQGVCPESMWPYVVSKFATKPTAGCYKAALDHQAVSYQRVLQNLMQMKGCIASGFNPLPTLSGSTVSASKALELVVASLLVYLMPILAVACIGLLLSALTRNSAAAIVGTLMVSLLIQLIGILPGLGGLRPYLLSEQFNAWQGLLRTPADWAPVIRSAWVCALYGLPALFAAYVVFLRRDVAGG